MISFSSSAVTQALVLHLIQWKYTPWFMAFLLVLDLHFIHSLRISRSRLEDAFRNPHWPLSCGLCEVGTSLQRGKGAHQVFPWQAQVHVHTACSVTHHQFPDFTFYSRRRMPTPGLRRMEKGREKKGHRSLLPALLNVALHAFSMH